MAVSSSARSPLAASHRLAGATVAALLLAVIFPGGTQAQTLPKAPAEAAPQAVPGFWDPRRRPERPDLSRITVIRFLTETDYPPFNFTGPDGNPAGFNVDLARALCEEIKVTCTVQMRRFETLLDAISSNRGDAIIASIAVTPQMRARVDFTDPYYRPPARFVSRKDAAMPLRALLTAGETPQGVNPAALDDPRLTPGDRNKIKAIGEGKAAFLPVGRSKENAFLMNKAYEYNPNLDQTMYGRRQKVENYFAVGTSGGGGQQIVALNRFAAHAGSLLALAEKLDEGQYPTWNSVRNALNRQGFGGLVGDKKDMQDILGAWDVNAKGVGDEAAKLFAGKDPALADREVWDKVMSPNTPLSTIKSKLKQAVEMAGPTGALGAIAASYNEGMRTNHNPREFMTPHTQEVFDAISHNRPIHEVSGAHGAAPAAAGPKALSGADQQAMEWANANPNDPRAAAIKQRLGVQ